VEPSCLVLEDLTKNFGGLTAVDHVNLEIQARERRVIIGPNGAGKTTLFNLISGQFPPSQGRILHFGKDVTRLPIHQRTAMGIARTFQITNLFPNLTVLQNLCLAAQGLEATKYVMYRPISSYPYLSEKAQKILEEVGLWEKRDILIKNLSHGEQRQIEIAMALIGEPRLLLLDEPTAGLSPAETHSFTDILKKLDPDMTILLIEHDMDVAFEFAENITVLHQGSLIASGKKEDIRANRTVQEIYLGLDQTC
jgi:branched-chain amino acid transport system ATP-binding protein